MKPTLIITASLAAIGLGLIPAQSWAVGIASRVWVSGHGTDTTGCGAPTAPCRSLQYAHDNVVVAGGEIDILDPAGYGAITITKSISIVNDGVGTAGVQASSADAIAIDAGPSDSVYLRGLNIDGQNDGALVGIQFNSGGELTVANCVLRHFANAGIFFVPSSGPAKAQISNTTLSDNGLAGIYLTGGENTSINVVLDRVSADNNPFGVHLYGAGDTGTVQLVMNSLEASSSGIGVLIATDRVNTFVEMHESTVSLNSLVGLDVQGQAWVHLAKSYLTFNDQGILNNGGTVLSAGDNHIVGNNINVSGPMGSEPLR